jgi:purine-binding chemotaxis protein CheW
MPKIKKEKKATKTKTLKDNLPGKMTADHAPAYGEGDKRLNSTQKVIETKSQQGVELDQSHGVDDVAQEEETIELLSFRLSNEEYAVNLLKVKEIIRLLEITRVPRAPSTINGVISLRGTIVTIYDLHSRLGLKKHPPNRKNRIIVVALEKGMVGYIADEVVEAFKFKVSEVEPPPSMLGEKQTEHLQGVVRLGDRMVILLDIQKAVTIEG